MGKKLMLIINPHAGKGRYKNAISNILEVLCKCGYSVTVYMTKQQGHASQLAQAHAGQYDILACCGGDGTLSETISGLMQSQKKPPLGYIPMGTANDVASTLRIPRNAVKAAQIIAEGKTIPFDVGVFHQHYFTYIAAFGAFTEVSHRTPKENKQILGNLAYMLEGVAQFTKITPQHLVVEYNGKRIEGEYIFGGVTNTTSIAGLVKIKSDLVELGDGLFEIILVKNPRNLNDVNRIFLDIFTQKYDPDHVMIFRASEIKFTFDKEVFWTRDGENGGRHKEVFLCARQAAISMIVPGGCLKNI